MSPSGRLSPPSSPPGKGRLPAADSVSQHQARDHWGSRAEFILSCLGYSVGLGNLWRFPYLAYENGGAAFLVPYLVLLACVGRPLYLMLVALGQYSQLGPLHTWRRATPLMAGLGISIVVRAAVTSISYMVIIGYSLHYMYYSLAYIGYKVPWATCDYEWADSRCYEAGVDTPCSLFNLTEPTAGVACSTGNQSSAQQYWQTQVLDLSPEGLVQFGDMGSVQVGLVLSLLVGWLCTCLSVMYGIKSSGKVVYFTATFPFIVLLVLMVAGLLLPGASKGLHFLFVPHWEKLLEVNVWRKAMEQVIYSLSIGGGGLITFGSYNDFNAKVHVDVIILAVLDLVASLLCATTIFSVLGAMAHELGVEDVSQVVASGPGLAFVAFPEAISRTLPLPHLWCFLFFFMVFTLGLDSMFATVETIMAAIFDEFPSSRQHKPVLVSLMCGLLFCCGLPYCMQKGQYLFYLMDVFLSGVGGLLFTFLASAALHWVYGVRRFSTDLQFMLGYSPSILMRGAWALLAPLSMLALFAGSMLRWRWPLYGGSIGYPSWAYLVAGGTPVVIISPFVVLFVLHLVKKIWSKDWGGILAPSSEWGPGCPVARQRLDEVHRLAREARQQRADGGKLAGVSNMAFETTSF